MNRRGFWLGCRPPSLGRELLSPSPRALAGTKLPNVRKSPFSGGREAEHDFRTSPPTTTSTSSAPTRATRRRTRGTLKTRPWTVDDRGRLVAKPADFDIDDSAQAGRRSRSASTGMRCVEAWSMVIPWVGFPLARAAQAGRADRRRRSTSRSTTLLRPGADARPADARVLDWPYVEGLRMDEAMHPLTLLAVGLYGKTLPNQNGAPLRLVVPWKYGFKGIKSIVQDHASSRSSRRPPGTWRPRTSTASTRT